MISPLRYPGGKSKLFSYLIRVIDSNALYGRTYAEPYAGGAGLALKLLAHGYVPKIELNDIDPAINSFWTSILRHTDEFCALLKSIDITVDEWKRQRDIYRDGLEAGTLALGFATYFLNRTSRSGIIEGSGPIGGYEQNSIWKIGARMNVEAQISQIVEIAKFSSQISIFGYDAVDFSKSRLCSDSYFTYLDPPYYVKGQKLYKNFYGHRDHVSIGKLLEDHRSGSWILSYDYAPQIVEIYSRFQPTIYNLQYSAGENSLGCEVIFSSDKIKLPMYPGFRIAA